MERTYDHIPLELRDTSNKYDFIIVIVIQDAYNK